VVTGPVKKTGEHYEQIAIEWLCDRGFQIVERNFRCKAGEIDIIARDGPQLVFVEVRARSNPRYASAAASVDWRKQRKLLRTAQFYLQTQPHSAKVPCRFDVIAIEPRQSSVDAAVNWIRAAFTQ
jgi:putative endonuclease